MWSGINKNNLECSFYQVINRENTVEKARQRSEIGGYYVLCANRHLSGAEIDLVEMESRELRLKNCLAPVLDDYDFVLIDCPPTLSLLTLKDRKSAVQAQSTTTTRAPATRRRNKQRREHGR